MDSFFVRVLTENWDINDGKSRYYADIYSVTFEQMINITFVPYFRKPSNWYIHTPLRSEDASTQYQARLHTVVFKSDIVITPDGKRAGTHFRVPKAPLETLMNTYGNLVPESQLLELYDDQATPWVFFVDDTEYESALSEIAPNVVRLYYKGTPMKPKQSPVLFNLLRLAGDSGVLPSYQMSTFRKIFQQSS